VHRVLAIAVATAVLLTGCSGLGLLRHGGSYGGRPQSHAAQVYLSLLAVEQGKLAAAERTLPLRPKTPEALSRSIGALARAIQRFAGGLATITPPAGVARLHRRLVAVARAYHDQLAQLSRRARRPAGEVAAANALAADTSAASTAFTATIVKIHARLVH
jgi:hypothetical protein